ILIEKYGSRFLENHILLPRSGDMRRHIRVQGSSIGGSKKTMGGYWSKSENQNEENMRIEMGMPQIILNYAFLLEENSYFEDALKVYERGVKKFKYPHTKFGWCREDKARAGESFFEYDVSMRAMKVYGKATKKVPEGQVSHVILPLFPLFSAHKQLSVLNFESPFVICRRKNKELNKAGFPEDEMTSLEKQAAHDPNVCHSYTKRWWKATRVCELRSHLKGIGNILNFLKRGIGNILNFLKRVTMGLMEKSK
ncbi:LOW QUALITY PROTEIN: hypothetical protein HID58_080258, partial [Brassica napus]